MEHACDLAERIGDLLFNEKYSDVIFIVEGERLPAHRNIVTTSCEYFRALLEGQMKESLQRDVTLNDIPLREFKLVMSYIYTGQLQVGDLADDAIQGALEIAHLYELSKLESALSQRLQDNLTTENVIAIYSRALFLRLDRLVEACHSFVADNHSAILQSEAFSDLSEADLCHLISQNTFCIDEIEIFNAVARWCAKKPAKSDHSNVLEAVRFPLIDTKDLLTTVKDSGLISTDVLLNAIQARACRYPEVKSRGWLKSGVNLVDPALGALRLIPKTRGNYEFSKTCPDYNSETLFPYHRCPDYDSEPMFPYARVLYITPATGLTIALSKPYSINHIEFTFYRPNLLCNYYVEVSTNLEDWARVIDHTKISCHSTQQLYFGARVARFIRIMITWTEPKEHNIGLTAPKVVHTSEPFKLTCGFFSPTENVASVALGTLIFEECHRMIRKQTFDAPGKSKWTSHGIGNGSIIISLTQPFTVDSMRMLLPSDGSQSYKYYVEVSLEEKEWTRVADQTETFCSSWQTILFEPRPVRYIRIIGTEATRDGVFKCSRFECPAPGLTPAASPVGDNKVEGSALEQERVHRRLLEPADPDLCVD